MRGRPIWIFIRNMSGAGNWRSLPRRFLGWLLFYIHQCRHSRRMAIQRRRPRQPRICNEYT